MDYLTAISTLKEAFRAPLPGAPAHALLAPRSRRPWPAGFDLRQIRRAAGLLLLRPHHDRAYVVLTVRASGLNRHGGQVSLPGGAVEPGETFEQAALREAQEEIGLRVDALRILGALTPIDIPVSGFRLYPIVAAATEPLAFSAAHGEVARILDVSVDDLLRPEALQTDTITGDGGTLVVPVLRVGDVSIWGATAMVLAEFLSMLRR